MANSVATASPEVDQDEFIICDRSNEFFGSETTYFDGSSPYGNPLQGGTYCVLIFDSKSLRSPALRAVFTVLSSIVTGRIEVGYVHSSN